MRSSLKFNLTVGLSLFHNGVHKEARTIPECEYEKYEKYIFKETRVYTPYKSVTIFSQTLACFWLNNHHQTDDDGCLTESVLRFLEKLFFVMNCTEVQSEIFRLKYFF